MQIARFRTFAAAAMALIALQAQASDTITVVQRPDTSQTNRFYASNRQPLEPSPFIKLPLGAIAPHGWLRHQLELEAKGMGGRLPEISQWLSFTNSGWADPNVESGGEEFPYWIRGYGDLGYVLHNKKITKEARRWLEAVMASQQPDGWFGPRRLRTSSDGDPGSKLGLPELFPHMPVLNAFQSYYESSGDKRVLAFLTKYFRWQLDSCPAKAFSIGWGSGRMGDNLESVYWLYNRTGDAWLLDLGKKIHDNALDWTSQVGCWHNVSMVEGFREPAEYSMQSKDRKLFDSAERHYQTIMGIYGQIPGGGFAGDEGCRQGYDDPRQGFETCGMVEFMHSFEMLSRISGDPAWADRCEEIAFNSLPAALTPDMKALHYLTAANMVQLDKENKHPGIDNKGTMFSYSPHIYRCCQHNQVMGWPYFAEELWQATPDNGLCALMYGASAVRAKVGTGTMVRITQETDYPFGDTIRLKLSAPREVEFPLYLRVPRWSGNPVITVNGKEMPVTAGPSSYVVLQRQWASGDVVTAKFPMSLSVRRWAKNKNSASVDYGPLTFSLKIGEKWTRYGGTDKWPEWEVFASTPWNYGLILDEKNPAKSFTLTRRSGSVDKAPFTANSAPITLSVKAQRLPNWTLDTNGLLNILPISPVTSSQPPETVTLVPMGAARLRISAFPVIANTK